MGGVARAAFPDDLAAFEVERRIETGESVSFVVVSLPSRNTFAQRQQRLRAIQGLDLGLLVQADDGGVLRRTQVQADDVADLLLGLGIGTEFESLDAVRFETVLLPDPMDGAVRKAGPIREFASTPVREPTGRRLERQRDDLSDLPLLDLPGRHGST